MNPLKIFKRKFYISIILIIPAILITIFFLFNKAIYIFLLNSLAYRKIPNSSIDAVMTLAFEPERIKKSLEWIEENPNSQWLISIGKHQIDLVQQYKIRDLNIVLSKYDLSGISSRIIKDSSCTNTFDEAKLISEMAIKNNWQQVLIVSAPYHMRRVKFIFEKLRPESIIYYYDHWDWKMYNEERNIYLYDSYHRRHWINPLNMKPPLNCWNFLIREWAKNVYYWIKY